ncbi:MAG: hypothetical protein Q8P58_02830 [Candidatus Adlerbacteria bacterium]|nr:hypothetical protein [Candidatus Adlerbacteria bacterium]
MLTTATARVSPQTTHTEEEHETWNILSRRNFKLIQQLPFHPQFVPGIQDMGMVGGGIPSFEKIDRMIFEATGWRLYHPTGGTSTKKVFALFAQKMFPVLSTIRPQNQIDRAEAPDLFHDYWGHLWMLRLFLIASICERFGQQSVRVIDSPKYFWMITHLYTHTIEFGLQFWHGRVMGFGAAIASSAEELRNALGSPIPLRVRLDPTCEVDVVNAMRRRYHFDRLQKRYFVVTDWQALFDLLGSDLTPYYEKAACLPRLNPGECCKTDVFVEL